MRDQGQNSTVTAQQLKQAAERKGVDNDEVEEAMLRTLCMVRTSRCLWPSLMYHSFRLKPKLYSQALMPP